MALRRSAGRMGVAAVVALAVGVVWFAICAVVLSELLPPVLASGVGVAVAATAVVLGIAHFWGIAYAVPVGVASVVAVDWYHIPPIHPSLVPDAQNLVALVAYLVTATLLGQLDVAIRRRADVSERARSALADEQAALRRVATLVARQGSPEEVFAAVTREAGGLLDVELSAMFRCGIDATATVVSSWGASGRQLEVGTRLTLEGIDLEEIARRTDESALVGPASTPGPLASFVRGLGVRAGAASPIVVDGRVWGVMVVARSSDLPLPAQVESQLEAFTELAATAVANAEARAELTESRARIVTTADEARRHIERDLHDGVQQRLVSLALDLRLAEELAGSGSAELAPQLSPIADGLTGVLGDLREISHGIHPAILSEGGLRPALSTLARRSTVPVELAVRSDERLPEPVEVGLYYVASEALTNVAKHAGATCARVDLETARSMTTLVVVDDGIGGADTRNGSGLIGMRDRVHALGGRLDISSPAGRGTSLQVTVPSGL